MAGKYAAKGSIFAYESATGPSVWSTIPAVGDFDLPLVGTKDTIDITSHDSTSEEKLLGTARTATISVPIVTWDGTDTHHAAMRSRAVADTLTNFKVTHKDTKISTFAGYIKGVTLGQPVNGAFGATMEVEITGAVTYT